MKHTCDQEYVDISHTLSAEQKELWNILFENARKHFDQTVHEISLHELLSQWSFEKSADDLMNALKKLAIVITYGIKNSNASYEQGAFCIMDGACIKDGTCRYEYSHMFKSFVRDSRMRLLLQTTELLPVA